MHGVHSVAVKVLAAASSQRETEALHTEISILRNNKNIVQFHGVCFKETEIWLVMELLERGSLHNALAHANKKCTWYHR